MFLLQYVMLCDMVRIKEDGHVDITVLSTPCYRVGQIWGCSNEKVRNDSVCTNVDLIQNIHHMPTHNDPTDEQAAGFLVPRSPVAVTNPVLQCP